MTGSAQRPAHEPLVSAGYDAGFRLRSAEPVAKGAELQRVFEVGILGIQTQMVFSATRLMTTDRVRAAARTGARR